MPRTTVVVEWAALCVLYVGTIFHAWSDAHWFSVALCSVVLAVLVFGAPPKLTLSGTFYRHGTYAALGAAWLSLLPLNVGGNPVLLTAGLLLALFWIVLALLGIRAARTSTV